MADNSIDALSYINVDEAGLHKAIDEQQELIESLQHQIDEATANLKSLRALAKVAEGGFDIAQLTGSAGASSTPSRRRSSAPRSTRRKVTPEDIVEAIQAGDGDSMSVEQLVEALDIPDGRSLNGARRIEVDAENPRFTYSDRTYTLTS